MTGLTTHVLDLTQGKPADALEISFYTTQSDRKELIFEKDGMKWYFMLENIWWQNIK